MRLAAHPVPLGSLSFYEFDPGLPDEDDVRRVAAKGDLVADAAGRRVAGAQRLVGVEQVVPLPDAAFVHKGGGRAVGELQVILVPPVAVG